MKQLKTIRIRFTLWVAFWLLAILAAFGAYVYHRFGNDLAASIDNELRLSAAETVTSISVENGRLNITDVASLAPTKSGLAKH